MYSNSYNNQIAKTKVLELSVANVQALRNTERLKFLKQFEGLNKKISNLEQALVTVVDIDQDSIPVTTIYLPCKDSVRVFHYQLVDEFNSISAMVVDTPRFDIQVPIYSAVYWQRKNKFLFWRVGRKQWFIESYSPNKLVDINKQELIKVQKKQ